MDELSQFIAKNPDPRELKRAIAVQMRRQGYTYQEIERLLQVCAGFISHWQSVFRERGLKGLGLGYQGAVAYLSKSERQAVLTWLQQKNYWHLAELQQHLEDTYEVVFQSKQSYYDLFKEAGISWKKTQSSNPRKDRELVEKKTANHGLVRSTSHRD